MSFAETTLVLVTIYVVLLHPLAHFQKTHIDARLVAIALAAASFSFGCLRSMRYRGSLTRSAGRPEFEAKESPRTTSP